MLNSIVFCKVFTALEHTPQTPLHEALWTLRVLLEVMQTITQTVGPLVF